GEQSLTRLQIFLDEAKQKTPRHPRAAVREGFQSRNELRDFGITQQALGAHAEKIERSGFVELLRHHEKTRPWEPVEDPAHEVLSGVSSGRRVDDVNGGSWHAENVAPRNGMSVEPAGHRSKRFRTEEA